MFFLKVFALSIALVCLVYSQTCDDEDVVCVGTGGEATLSAALDLVTPSSGIMYILILENLLISDEPGSTYTINDTLAAGTDGSYITIMPDPALDTPVEIHFDTNTGAGMYYWLRIQRPYWRISGGEDKMLKIIIDSDFAGSNSDNHGLIFIDELSGGKTMIDNMIFISKFGSYYMNKAIALACRFNCDDAEFDDIIIDSVDFIDEAGYFTGIKMFMNASSWDTKKLTMKDCTFSSPTNDLHCGVRISVYTIDSDLNWVHAMGCLNCEFYDNVFTNVYRPFHIDAGSDINIHDNEFYMNSNCDYAVLDFYCDECTTDDPPLENLFFYDNVVNYTDGDCGTAFIYIYMDDYPDNTDPWLVNMQIKNNEIINLPHPLIYSEYIKQGVDVTFDGNVVSVDSSIYDDHCMFYFYNENEADPASYGEKSLTLINNKIEWDLSAYSYTANTSWVYSRGTALDLKVAYNLFDATENDDVHLHFLRGDEYILGTTIKAFGDIEVYGNVIYQDKVVTEFAVDEDLDDFMNECDSLTVTNNLFSTDYEFPTGAGVTVEDNEVDSDKEFYDVNDPCETDYFVPYDEDYTPEDDINGEERSTSGDTWIGPEICPPIPPPPVMDTGYVLSAMFGLVALVFLM